MIKDMIIEENENKIIILKGDMKIIANKNSKVDVISFNLNSKKEAIIEENAEVNFYEICLDGNNSEVICYLNGKNSKTNNYGIFFGVNNNEINMKASVVHNNLNTKSNLVCKGVLDNNSKLKYTGKITMNKGSKNSEGYQKQDSLLLSKYSSSISIPELEILENDVKCSHGVTKSKINNDQLFYLMSRGLNLKEAQKEIIKGFFYPIISKIKENRIQKEVDNVIEDRLL